MKLFRKRRPVIVFHRDKGFIEFPLDAEIRYVGEKPDALTTEAIGNRAKAVRKSQTAVVLAEVLQQAEWGVLKGPSNSEDLWVILAGVVERSLKERGYSVAPIKQKNRPAPKPRPPMTPDPGKLSS